MSAHGPKLPTGTTVRVMFQDCQCDGALLNQPESVIPLMQKAIRAVKLNDLNFTHWAFEGGGSTLAFILSESHVAMHTWPEFDQMVLIDVSVCDFRLSNRARTIALCDRFAEIFRPTKILREIEDMIPRMEELTPQGVSQALEVREVIERRVSAHNSIIIAETKGFGRTLMVDGVLQIAEREHHPYTESMIHIPLMEVDTPRKVLICGGADGASAHNALMHPSVERVLVVDQDADILDLCRSHLPDVHRGSFDDARCSFVAANVAQWVKEHSRSADFDAILFDTTDPTSVAESLYSHALLEQASNMLSADGVLALHIGAPSQYPEAAKLVVDRAVAIFGTVYPYWAFVPLYGTYLVWLLCYKRAPVVLNTVAKVKSLMESRGLEGNTRYVTWETYHASFCIPPSIRAHLPGVTFYSPSLN